MRTATRRSLILPSAVIIWALATSTVAAAGAGNPLRSALVLPFLCAGPGLALVPLLRIGGLAGLTLAVGISLAIDALLPTAMIYAGLWSPDATLAVLVVLSLLGAAGQLAVGILGPRPTVEPAQ